MRGNPKLLKTKEDYLFAVENLPKEYCEKELTKLLETQYDWFFVKLLDNVDDGVNDDTHKVIKYEQDGKKEFAQYELKYNNNCKLKQLFFTENEVKELLNNVQQR